MAKPDSDVKSVNVTTLKQKNKKYETKMKKDTFTDFSNVLIQYKKKSKKNDGNTMPSKWWFVVDDDDDRHDEKKREKEKKKSWEKRKRK